VLGIRGHQSAVPEKNGEEAYPPFCDTLIVVSVNIVSIPLYINIVLISLFCCCMCGLPGHTYDEPSFVLCKTGCDKDMKTPSFLRDLFEYHKCPH
jgi:hypothetical protein